MERLSGLDASFLYLETPENHMHVAMTAVLDTKSMPGKYNFEDVLELISSRVHLLPPFTKRLARVPFDLLVFFLLLFPTLHTFLGQCLDFAPPRLSFPSPESLATS